MPVDKEENMNAGKCDTCSYEGPLQLIRNDLADPPLEFNLCPKCTRKAIISMQMFIQTPVGRKRFIEKYGTQKGAHVKAK